MTEADADKRLFDAIGKFKVCGCGQCFTRILQAAADLRDASAISDHADASEAERDFFHLYQNGLPTLH